MILQSIEGLAKEACLDVGIEYITVPADGKFHLTKLIDGLKKGNGRIKLFSDLKGGIAFNWVTGQSQTFFINHSTGVNISKEEKTRICAEKARRKAELITQKNKAAIKAQSLWVRGKPASKGHPYLIKKCIQPYFIRSGNWEKWVLSDGDKWKKIIIENVLLIPLFNYSGVIRNLQAIFPTIPPELERNKDFLPKAELSGLFSWIGKQSDTVCIAEGVATAFTIHEETGFRVYIAFFKDNLKAVVGQVIRKHLPKAKIIFCADNDKKTKGNPGLTKATEAAAVVDGLVAVPPIAGDFNDYAIYLKGAQ